MDPFEILFFFFFFELLFSGTTRMGKNFYLINVWLSKKVKGHPVMSAEITLQRLVKASLKSFNNFSLKETLKLLFLR